jgi:hypothetical protein
MLATAVLGLVVGKPGGTAQAGVIIDITQVGPDVVTTVSGTINLTGLTHFLSSSTVPTITPADASVYLGPVGGGNYDAYSGVIGPTSFGPGGEVVASSGSGDFFGKGFAVGGVSPIVVPQGYVSGTFLSATDTYANQTFSSLGLTPGTYTYTWSSDSLTVQIVPEPASIVQVGIGGLMGLVYYAWRRRRAKPPA